MLVTGIVQDDEINSKSEPERENHKSIIVNSLGN
jgi:hypothetical protein